MITKEHWAEYVDHIDKLKRAGFTILLKGNLVWSTKGDHTIICKEGPTGIWGRNNPLIIYKHPDSLTDYTVPDELYKNLEIRRNMNSKRITRQLVEKLK